MTKKQQIALLAKLDDLSVDLINICAEYGIEPTNCEELDEALASLTGLMQRLQSIEETAAKGVSQ